MKRIITLVLTMMIAFTVSAQKEVTKFLGIPVDGTKNEMIQKLKAKGFTYNAKDDYLAGEFNGRDVYILIGTNNNKVWRIMVHDPRGTNSETEIKLRFNTLCRQFSKNGKYRPKDLVGDYEISEDEDISYEMTAHDKRYQASYLQLSDDGNLLDMFNRPVWFMISQDLGEYFIVIYYDNEYNKAHGEDL
ncbi:MAG: hypothetical protein MJZ45_01710 [Bacteroidales bacterium]|nr:hypothetical protein [Bacteroidales bacterium]